MSEDYRVNLEIYNGPLDLLLYLIRREEVDIHDIPIARITEQYCAYVEVLKGMDPNLAGEFLVLAATLMEVKTQMLLPQQLAEDGSEDSLEIDPRAELVRQLLQYKAFKDAAYGLSEAAALQQMKFPRQPGKFHDDAEDADVDLEEVQVWDLLDAFSKLMEATGQRARLHEVIYDDTPIETHAEDVLDRLQREGPLGFTDIFAGRDNRSEIIGLFLALLELAKRRAILLKQDANFGEIFLAVNPNPPTPEELEAMSREMREADAQAQADAEALAEARVKALAEAKAQQALETPPMPTDEIGGVEPDTSPNPLESLDDTEPETLTDDP